MDTKSYMGVPCTTISMKTKSQILFLGCEAIYPTTAHVYLAEIFQSVFLNPFCPLGRVSPQCSPQTMPGLLFSRELL